MNFFFLSCYWIHNLTQSLFLTYHSANFILFCLVISLRLGSPGFIKPSGFFWAPLQPYNSYMYSCIVLTELNAFLKFEISRNAKLQTRNCKLRIPVCGLPDAKVSITHEITWNHSDFMMLTPRTYRSSYPCRWTRVTQSLRKRLVVKNIQNFYAGSDQLLSKRKRNLKSSVSSIGGMF